jgi:hypothetical protein
VNNSNLDDTDRLVRSSHIFRSAQGSYKILIARVCSFLFIYFAKMSAAVIKAVTHRTKYDNAAPIFRFSLTDNFDPAWFKFFKYLEAL